MCVWLPITPVTLPSKKCPNEFFSDDAVNNLSNYEKIEKKDIKIFEKSNYEKENKIKEQEMFEETNLEENFEIPAFLRRQKN